MANCSIQNSTPAIGRISTPLSRRSRKQNSASACFFEPFRLPNAIRSCAPRFFNAQRSTSNTQRSIQTVGRWMLGVGCWAFSSLGRVKGAWWSSRSSKPLSVPHTRDRGRFDSYPLRLNFPRHLERIPQAREESKDRVAVSRGISSGFLDFARNDESQRG